MVRTLMRPTRPGLVYKKGSFSAIEEQSIKDAIEQYRIVSAFSVSFIKTSTSYLHLPGTRTYRRGYT